MSHDFTLYHVSLSITARLSTGQMETTGKDLKLLDRATFTCKLWRLYLHHASFYLCFF
jgi:hypothetical protein